MTADDQDNGSFTMNDDAETKKREFNVLFAGLKPYVDHGQERSTMGTADKMFLWVYASPTNYGFFMNKLVEVRGTDKDAFYLLACALNLGPSEFQKKFGPKAEITSHPFIDVLIHDYVAAPDRETRSIIASILFSRYRLSKGKKIEGIFHINDLEPLAKKIKEVFFSGDRLAIQSIRWDLSLLFKHHHDSEILHDMAMEIALEKSIPDSHRITPFIYSTNPNPTSERSVGFLNRIISDYLVADEWLVRRALKAVSKKHPIISFDINRDDCRRLFENIVRVSKSEGIDAKTIVASIHAASRFDSEEARQFLFSFINAGKPDAFGIAAIEDIGRLLEFSGMELKNWEARKVCSFLIAVYRDMGNIDFSPLDSEFPYKEILKDSLPPDEEGTGFPEDPSTHLANSAIWLVAKNLVESESCAESKGKLKRILLEIDEIPEGI